MPDNPSYNLNETPQSEQEKVGVVVASLKADLHEAENQITHLRIQDVDWGKILDRAERLINLIRVLSKMAGAESTSKADEHEKRAEATPVQKPTLPPPGPALHRRKR